MNMATTETGDDKKKALTMALSQIEKQFGKGSVMKMGDQPPPQKLHLLVPARWVLILLWEQEDYPMVELLKFTDRNHLVKRH